MDMTALRSIFGGINCHSPFSTFSFSPTSGDLIVGCEEGQLLRVNVDVGRAHVIFRPADEEDLTSAIGGGRRDSKSSKSSTGGGGGGGTGGATAALAANAVVAAAMNIRPQGIHCGGIGGREATECKIDKRF